MKSKPGRCQACGGFLHWEPAAIRCLACGRTAERPHAVAAEARSLQYMIDRALKPRSAECQELSGGRR